MSDTTTVSNEKRQLVEDKVKWCLEKARGIYGMDRVKGLNRIEYKTKRTTAGWAEYNRRTGEHSINLNPILFNENVEQFLNRTVVHEVAHVVVRMVYGDNAKPHGYEWKGVMRMFGGEVSRCHSYDTSTIIRNREARGNRGYRYKCDCSVYAMSAYKHNKILGGRYYVCRKCKVRLVLDTLQEA